LGEGEEGWRAPAEKDGARGDLIRHEFQLAAQGGHIAVNDFRLGAFRIEGAVFALPGAKRDVDVKAFDRDYETSHHAIRLVPNRNLLKGKRDSPDRLLGTVLPESLSVLSSNSLDVESFRPFFALHEFVVDDFSFLEGFVAIPIDARVVHKDILSLFLGNEPEPSAVIEPLYLSTGHNLSFRELRAGGA
jgi:hypothetical protein